MIMYMFVCWVLSDICGFYFLRNLLFCDICVGGFEMNVLSGKSNIVLQKWVTVCLRKLSFNKLFWEIKRN